MSVKPKAYTVSITLWKPFISPSSQIDVIPFPMTSLSICRRCWTLHSSFKGNTKALDKSIPFLQSVSFP